MMTRKQLKAIRRHKAIVRKRNIRTNNLKQAPAMHFVNRSASYRLYDF